MTRCQILQWNYILIETEACPSKVFLCSVQDDLRDAIELIRTYMSEAIHGEYIGPFGVDMMVLPGKTICPCVEINLRRTMGHVALSLYDKDNYPQQRIMRIDYSGKYHFRIKETMDNVINNSLI